MAITSRAARNTTLLNKTTPTNVGPGIYDLDKIYSIAAVCSPNKGVKGYGGRIIYPKQVAFSSHVERNVLYYDIDDKPPPGSYYHENIIEKEPETHGAFRSRTSRWQVTKSQTNDTPGPGSYNVDKPERLKKRLINPNHRPHTCTIDGYDDHMHNESNVIHGIMNPPSIPHSGCKYGYDQLPTGQLIPRQAPPISSASYQNASHSSMDLSYASMQQSENQGSAWSRSTSKRFTNPTTIYTGDANELKEIKKYEKEKKREKAKMHESPPTNKRSISKTSNSATSQSYNRQKSNESSNANSNNKNNNNKENKNHVNSQSQKIKIRESNKLSREKFLAKMNQNKNNPVSSAFASATQRFENKNEQKIKDLPGPGTYDIPLDWNKKSNDIQTAILNRRAMTHPKPLIEHVPRKRKRNSKRNKPEPGPGTYDIPSCFKSIDDIQTEAILLGQPHKPPFSSSLARFSENNPNKINVHNNNSDVTGPGPQDYQSLDGPNMIASQYTDVSTTVIDAKTHAKLALTRLHNGYFTINYHQAPFGSHGTRFQNNNKNQIESMPGPGKYDITKKYEIKPKTGERYCGGASHVFKSKALRNTYLTSSQDQTNPPPGIYDVATSFNNLVSYKPPTSKNRQFTAPFSTSSQRLPKESQYALKTPGPGVYDIVANDPNNGLYKLSTNTGRVKTGKNAPFSTTSARIIATNEMQRTIQTPGPGTYQTQNSFITKTFNKTFG